uniref:Sushi domain-containing protein n=1 Tax=Salmo trutta TaxID=8032 RepID=A0A674A478_SALTR
KKILILDQVQKRYENGNQIDYICISPYKGPGGKATCQNREWLMPPKDFCGPPPHLINGDTIGRTRECYRNRESVHYDCQSYYTLNSHSSYKMCPSEIWIGEMACLIWDEQLSPSSVGFHQQCIHGVMTLPLCPY